MAQGFNCLLPGSLSCTKSDGELWTHNALPASVLSGAIVKGEARGLSGTGLAARAGEAKPCDPGVPLLDM